MLDMKIEWRITWRGVNTGGERKELDSRIGLGGGGVVNIIQCAVMWATS